MTLERKIVLVGLMGTGKSTVAERLAGRDAAVADTDAMIEESMGRSVRQIFSQDGEERFRDAESEALAAALASHAAVVAAAGGVVVRAANRDLLVKAREEGRAIVIWLRAEVGTLAARVSGGEHRPLLDGDAVESLRALEAEREMLYREVCDAVVDTDEMSVDEVVAAVIQIAEGDRS